MSMTEKDLNQKLRPQTDLKSEFKVASHIIDASLVNIEAQSVYLNSNKFKPEDLPEELRKYEERVLQQLD